MDLSVHRSPCARTDVSRTVLRPLHGRAPRIECVGSNGGLALPVEQAWRPHTAAGHGLRRQPVPSASGAQSAIVVGREAPIHTDRDHRVIVQQHWQRGDNGAGGLDHPRHPNAPADPGAGTWARVLTPLAGDNWGGVMLPRVGQEVWLDYLEGDIDRPVVVASLYNGRGQDDAPFNRFTGGPSGATGNAPAWFTGNRHPGVLSGFKTQDLASSARGTGGYRQLRFDDSPGQIHAQLATTDYASQLTLGHWKQLDDNARAADLGFGANLATHAQGAVRAGSGLLLTTSPGPQQMNASEAVALLRQHTELAQSLADVAHQQQAGLAAEPAAADLAPVAARSTLATDLAATASGRTAGYGIGGGEGEAAAWSRPHLLAHGAAGLLALTPADQIWVSGTDTTLDAGADLNWITRGQWSAVATQGIALYAQGQPPGSRPVTTTGIQLHTASGSLVAEAQQGQARLTAQQAITVSSSTASITAEAKGHLQLAAAGAYLRLEDGNIEIGGPGIAEFKGAAREIAGPQSVSTKASLPTAEVKACEFSAGAADASGAALMGAG